MKRRALFQAALAALLGMLGIKPQTKEAPRYRTVTTYHAGTRQVESIRLEPVH